MATHSRTFSCCGDKTHVLARRSSRNRILTFVIGLNNDSILRQLLLRQNHFLRAFHDEISPGIQRTFSCPFKRTEQNQQPSVHGLRHLSPCWAFPQPDICNFHVVHVPSLASSASLFPASQHLLHRSMIGSRPIWMPFCFTTFSPSVYCTSTVIGAE